MVIKNINGELKEKLLAYKDKITNETLTTQAYLTVRHAINHLELEPGEAFLEREIAELLEMSRTPVHSALIRLEMDGWLEIIPRRGFTVAPIEAEHIQQVSQITETLDGLAVQLAMDHLNEEQIDELNELIKQQEASLLENNFKKYVDIDQKFHSIITKNSHNDVLVTFLESYSDQLFRARLYTIDSRAFPLRSIDEHKAIVAAIQAKNPLAVRSLMEIHRHRGNKEIVKIIQEKEKLVQ